MRDTVKPRKQLRLFAEVIDTVVTRDHVSDAGTFIRPPPGRGWRVADYSQEKRTTWQRRRPVVLRWRRPC
jgi:hypothetical protein